MELVHKARREELFTWGSVGVVGGVVGMGAVSSAAHFALGCLSQRPPILLKGAFTVLSGLGTAAGLLVLMSRFEGASPLAMNLRMKQASPPFSALNGKKHGEYFTIDIQLTEDQFMYRHHLMRHKFEGDEMAQHPLNSCPFGNIAESRVESKAGLTTFGLAFATSSRLSAHQGWLLRSLRYSPTLHEITPSRGGLLSD